ncbi:MAG TPA: choice-of-anchor D domain-containing protein, partial [Kofleriaceae bacterium]|nr:choice-of-anchor D domain-containing protein [Kofleriaceae bacterium]
GNVLVGANDSQVFTVTNGGQQATGTLAISKSGAADFTITGDTCNGQIVAGGGTCAVTVRFAPGSAGAKSGSVSVTGAPGGSDSSTFSGTGQDPAVLGGSTSTLPFGNHEVAVSSNALTWTITNSGDVPTGTLSLTNTNTGEFSTTSTCGSTLAGGASCTVSATFTASTGGARSGMLTMSASPGGSTSVSMTGVGMYRLSVDRTGTGTVTSSVAGINCGTDCTELYAAGASVTLQARTANGTDMFFDGWSGAGCSGWFRDCTVTMNQSRTVGARFSTQTHNLVFMTSTTHATNLGSVANYDAQCNTSATAAGLNNSAGNGFVAHISSSSSEAGSRIGNANGWRRMDGKAFARDQNGLFNLKEIFNPIRFDEHGRDIGNGLALTGSTSSGTSSGYTCTDWTSTTGDLTVGSGLGGPELWSSGLNTTCAAHRLICMGVNHFTALTPSTSLGKRIYRTVRPYYIGSTTTPDQMCESEKPQGTGTVRALLAYTTAPASALLTASATYVRPDGQVVGTGTQIIAGGTLESGIWQAGDGTYALSAGGRSWTGHTTLTANGTTASTCGNWTNVQAGNGRQGWQSSATGWFWSFTDQACSTTSSTAGYLYCVEQ